MHLKRFKDRAFGMTLNTHTHTYRQSRRNQRRQQDGCDSRTFPEGYYNTDLKRKTLKHAVIFNSIKCYKGIEEDRDGGEAAGCAVSEVD